jgi:carbamoyl-phosphate synthase small subunit
LADGTVFEGRPLGFEGEAVGEVVFNTAMTGYQEVLTDPSYKGQIITMTSPHIGNYGVTPEDVESTRIWAEGFVVKEASERDSNWRSKQGLHGSPAICVNTAHSRASSRIEKITRSERWTRPVRRPA